MTQDSHPPTIPGLDIVDVIAEGGQATLYRAHQPGHDRTVALKVPHTRLADEAAARRFDRERTALGRLSAHPAIVALLDSGATDDDRPYLVLEYAPGGTLADRLGLGPMSVDEATDLAVRLAGALECAHRAGVLHRDLKPHNIVRSNYGQWQLTDFGIAAVTGTGPATQTVQVSFAHAAPESYEAGASTVRSDIYSLASTIYTALTGEEPFAQTDDEVALSTIRRAMFEPAPDLALHGVPDGLARLLQESLRKDPEGRPPTAASFGEAVNDQREELGMPPVPLVLGIAASAMAGQSPPAGPTREADVSGAFHRVGPDGQELDQGTSFGGEAVGRRWRRKRRRAASGHRGRIASVAATMAVAAVALLASVGLFNNDADIIDDIVDTVSVAPAAADVVPDLDLEDVFTGDNGPDGGGRRGGPDGAGPPDGEGPEGGRPNRGP